MRQHWPILAIALLCWLVIVDPTPATAHAVLLRSTPPTGQTLPRPPDRVQLLFSEPIDPVFSAVRVLNDQGQPVDRGDSQVDAANDHILAVSLPPELPNGIYRVSWRSLSTIDVHPDAGEYSLFVGVPVSESTSATATTYQATATPATTFGRWWFYVAASLFGGVLLTFKLVLSGVLVGEFAERRAEVRRRAFRLIVLGGCLLVVGTLFTAVAQAAAAADVSLTDAMGRPLADLLLRGRFATIWWPRLGLEVASLLLIALGGLEGLAAECALATLPAVLLTSSLTSHGAALPAGTAPGIVIDWLHVLGATAWVGALITILSLLPMLKGGLISRFVPRFSRFALAASGLIVLSGAVQATLEIGAWTALLTTTYGQLVLVKVGLIGSMFVVAGLNRWRAAALRMGIRAELTLGVLALATAAVLSGTPPPRG
jgi:copper transport protein